MFESREIPYTHATATQATKKQRYLYVCPNTTNPLQSPQAAEPLPSHFFVPLLIEYSRISVYVLHVEHIHITFNLSRGEKRRTQNLLINPKGLDRRFRRVGRFPPRGAGFRRRGAHDSYNNKAFD